MTDIYRLSVAGRYTVAAKLVARAGKAGLQPYGLLVAAVDDGLSAARGCVLQGVAELGVSLSSLFFVGLGVSGKAAYGVSSGIVEECRTLVQRDLVATAGDSFTSIWVVKIEI